MVLIRRLTLTSGTGTSSVDVTFSDPVSRGTSWVCSYRIDWPGVPATSEIGGADGPHALYLAMQAVALSLYASPYHKAGQLSWRTPGQGYGFPIPRAARGDLVGYDRDEQL